MRGPIRFMAWCLVTDRVRIHDVVLASWHSLATHRDFVAWNLTLDRSLVAVTTDTFLRP